LWSGEGSFGKGGKKMRLKVLPFGVAAGLVWGAIVFLATVIIVLQGEGGKTLITLSNFYLGFSVTWLGSFIGFIWGFITGLVAGLVMAIIYNLLAGGKELEGKESTAP
jgi:hypothetical protein